MTAGGTSRPRSAVSISPILPDFTSSEEGYGQMSRLQSDSDADIRLRKIEDALKSLQSQLAKVHMMLTHLIPTPCFVELR